MIFSIKTENLVLKISVHFDIDEYSNWSYCLTALNDTLIYSEQNTSMFNVAILKLGKVHPKLYNHLKIPGHGTPWVHSELAGNPSNKVHKWRATSS